MISYFPPTPGMVALQGTVRCTVLRRVKVGVSSLNTPLYEWQSVGAIHGTIMPRSGTLRMVTPGLTAISSHQFFTQYRLSRDGDYIVRPRDILVDGERAYLVKFAADEGGAKVYLTADLEYGSLNTLKTLSEQG